MLCITGSRDDDVLGTHATAARRIGTWDDRLAGRKAQLVLNDADHMTFAGQTGRAVEILPRDNLTRQLHRNIMCRWPPSAPTGGAHGCWTTKGRQPAC